MLYYYFPDLAEALGLSIENNDVRTVIGPKGDPGHPAPPDQSLISSRLVIPELKGPLSGYFGLKFDNFGEVAPLNIVDTINTKSIPVYRIPEPVRLHGICASITTSNQKKTSQNASFEVIVYHAVNPDVAMSETFNPILSTTLIIATSSAVRELFATNDTRANVPLKLNPGDLIAVVVRPPSIELDLGKTTFDAFVTIRKETS